MSSYTQKDPIGGRARDATRSETNQQDGRERKVGSER